MFTEIKLEKITPEKGKFSSLGRKVEQSSKRVPPNKGKNELKTIEVKQIGVISSVVYDRNDDDKILYIIISTMNKNQKSCTVKAKPEEFPSDKKLGGPDIRMYSKCSFLVEIDKGVPFAKDVSYPESNSDVFYNCVNLLTKRKSSSKDMGWVLGKLLIMERAKAYQGTEKEISEHLVLELVKDSDFFYCQKTDRLHLTSKLE